MASQEKPGLIYYVHPVKAAVVRTGQISRFAVQIDGQDLTTNITVAQVAFWNAGKKPIRANSMLSPFVIRTVDKSRILEVKIRKTSRDVVKIIPKTARLADGEVEISWNILEHNDGGVLQIVYAGDETVDIRADAVIEGQGEIVELKYTRELRSPGEEYTRRQGIKGQLPHYMILLLAAIMLLLSLWMIIRARRRGKRVEIIVWVMSIQTPIMAGVGVWGLLTQLPPGPPFGF